MTTSVVAAAGTIPIWSAGRRSSFLLGPAFGSTLRDYQRKGRVQWSAACHQADLDLFTLAKRSLPTQTSRYVRSPMTRRWDAPLVSGWRIARALYFLAATAIQPVSIRNCVSHFQLIFNFQLSTFNLLPLTTRHSSSACPARRPGDLHPKGPA